MVSFIDNVRALPPCKDCGSNEVKEKGKDLKIDWFGNWKGEWTCRNGHKNIL